MNADPRSKADPTIPSTLRPLGDGMKGERGYASVMRQRVMRQIKEKVGRKPEERPGTHGVSTEAKHRGSPSILGTGPSFKEALRAIPPAGDDREFERGAQADRPVEL